VIPAGEYVHVNHSGKWETVHFTLDYIYHTWVMKTGNKSPIPFEIISISDEYPRTDNEPIDYAIFVPIRIMDA